MPLFFVALSSLLLLCAWLLPQQFFADATSRLLSFLLLFFVPFLCAFLLLFFDVLALLFQLLLSDAWLLLVLF